MQKQSFIWLTYKVTRETRDAVTIQFDIDGPHFNYLPGQFINVSLVVDGEKITRSYSLSSSPGLDSRPAITVKRVKGGSMSEYITTYAEQIQQWEIEGPYGSFVVVESNYQNKHIALLSGGSGITPLLSIAKSLLNRSADVQLTLVYASRSWQDVIFANSFQELALQHEERFRVFHALSQHDGTKLDFLGTLVEEKLSKLVTKKLLKQSIGGEFSNSQFFICGPNGLMKMYQQTLESLQVPKDNIFMERFTDEGPISLPGLPMIQREVLVHFYEQTHLIAVPPETSILNAALSHGIPFQYSCKTGSCGSCVALLTSGKVNMLQNYALTENEVAQGMVLLCQCYPLSEDVTIEFD